MVTYYWPHFILPFSISFSNCSRLAMSRSGSLSFVFFFSIIGGGGGF